MKMLIQQIRSFGSPRKGYGVHVLSQRGKPEVPFRAPTYNRKGGSNLSSTRQGGFIILILERLASLSEATVSLAGVTGLITKISPFGRGYKPLSVENTRIVRGKTLSGAVLNLFGRGCNPFAYLSLSVPSGKTFIISVLIHLRASSGDIHQSVGQGESISTREKPLFSI